MTTFMLYGKTLSSSNLIHFMLPKSVYILQDINFHTFWGYLIFLWLVFCKILEPNTRFTLRMYSDVRDCFISTNESGTPRIYSPPVLRVRYIQIEPLALNILSYVVPLQDITKWTLNVITVDFNLFLERDNAAASKILYHIKLWSQQ
jgi:hypothetical protein